MGQRPIVIVAHDQPLQMLAILTQVRTDLAERYIGIEPFDDFPPAEFERAYYYELERQAIAV
jgi:hypothetical protein